MWTFTTLIQQVSTKAWPVFCQCSVHFEGTQIWAVLCLSAEWITIVYLTGSHWPILFCLKLQNNTQAHLRALWMSFASGTDSSAQESGCSPNTIFVRVALFQTFTVYYILQPSRFVQRWGFGYNLKIPVKSTFMFLITLKHFKGYRKCFHQPAQLCREGKKVISTRVIWFK